MNTKPINQRQTKYCLAIKQRLKSMGHATNAELLYDLRKKFPELSATTIHRATSRLESRACITTAPSCCDGSMRYDANTKPHDHFQCTTCGMIKDVNVKDKIISVLESNICDCIISGQITINGKCKKCIHKGEKDENNNI
jgi:Fur family peroxide stress response transcriptional regulator